MRKRKFVVGAECKELLNEAVEKRLPISLTTKANEHWQMFKSTFLSLKSNRLVLELPTPYLNECAMEPTPGQEMAITFKKGFNKCLFVTRVIAQQKFELEPDMLVPAITVYCPEQIEKIKRRAFNRTEPPADEDISVTFSPTQNPEQVFQGTLANISAGGVGVTVSKDELPELQDNDQFDVEFVPMQGQIPLKFQARYRHTSEVTFGPNALLGFQIIGLELSEEGRAVLRRLSRIVSVFERQQPLSSHKNFRNKR